jgi:xanthine dehydrogenase accessory factor
MDNLDVMVLRSLRDWRKSGHRALLATVVRTWGSSPRPVGSIMALCDSGSVVGSVSGGCIEDDLIDRFTKAYANAARVGSSDTSTSRGTASADLSQIPSGPPQHVKYGITAEEAHRFGLPCGGTLELLLEFDPATAQLEELVQRLEKGELVQRVTVLATGESHLQASTSPQDLLIDTEKLVNTFGPEYRMLLIGAGQMTEYLATMAIFNGFAVTVCDPREEYRGAWSVTGVALSSEMPDDVVRSFVPDRRSCVIALTHDPKLDDLALLEALESDAFYIGAIGSRRNNTARHQRMKEHFEQTDESLARLRGPIGIYIGSKTPAEIAVSIMAEVLAVKNAVPLPRDMDVAHAKNSQHIAHDSDSIAASEIVCGIPNRT